MSQVFASLVSQVIPAPAKVAPVKVAKTLKPAKAAAPAIPYAIHNGSRPGSGALLFAFTHAWLSMSGLASGKAYPKAQAQQVAGKTAIAYHLDNGNFSVDASGNLRITAKGQRKFSERTNDAETVSAWVQVLKTGKPGKVGPKAADEFFAVK